MTEEEALVWLAARVPRETLALLARFKDAVTAANESQNLIAVSTVPHIWARHFVDSAQLLELAPGSGGWADLGSGAGFPGMVIGLLGAHDVALIESRAKRVAFLSDAIASLGIAAHVAVHARRVETLVAPAFAVISARAFAPLDRLLATAFHLSNHDTRWILPKGRSAKAELDVARLSWHGDFSIVPSITDPDASIIVAENVRPRGDIRKK